MVSKIQFDMPKDKSSIIKVIGVGGGGGNAVNHMYSQGIKGVDFLICNTDSQALEMSPIPNKIQLGTHLTEGRGAGANPEVGRKAAMESIEAIIDGLGVNTKMLFITAGMGGGTGTGAAPIIAKTAKEFGMLTVGIVTMPFTFEGKKRRMFAEEGLNNFKKNVDCLLVISNEKIKETFGNMSLRTAFSEADTILTIAAKGIAEIITVPGYINVDFEDVNFVMKNSGVAIMGSAISSGENRARRVIEDALNSPLLEDNDIRGARHILLNITTGKTPEITMDEVAEITEYIQQEAGYDTDLIWGSCVDQNLEDKISVTLIATGFGTGYKNRQDAEPKEIRVSLNDDVRPDIFVESKITESARIFDFDEMEESIPAPTVPTSAEREISERKSYEHIVRRESTAPEQNITTPTLFGSTKATPIRPLSEGKILADTENTPAYERKNVRLDQVMPSSETNISRTRIFIEDEKAEIRQDSSFLHDNVD